MQTFRIRVNDKIVKNMMWFLQRFNSDEIQVISENSEFLSVQKYLETGLHLMETGKSEFISIEDLEKELEETIRCHES
jgi:hypothetical protein